MATDAQPGRGSSETCTDVGGPLSTAAPGRRLDHADWISFGVTALLAFAVYLATLAPSVTLELSGAFTTGAMYAGVPFSGGYPVWTIYSWLFIHLVPISNVAWRVNLSSAVATAVACGLIALSVSHTGKTVLGKWNCVSESHTAQQKLIRCICGYVAGLAFGLSGAVWNKAVIGEYWALGALLFVSALWLFTRWFFEPAKRGYLYGAFFAIGLLLTNNQELLVAIPAFVIGTMFADKKLGRDASLIVLPVAAASTACNQWWLWIDFPARPNWPVLAMFLIAPMLGIYLVLRLRTGGMQLKAALACAAWFVAGFAFYLYTPLASMATPPINWGYARTVEGFLHTIGRGQFESPNPTSDLGLFARQLWWFTKLLSKDYGLLYLALAALPIGLLRALVQRGALWVLTLLVLFLCIGVGMVPMLNPPGDRSSVDTLRPYFTASYAVLACMTGLGLMLIATRIAKPKPATNHSPYLRTATGYGD